MGTDISGFPAITGDRPLKNGFVHKNRLNIKGIFERFAGRAAIVQHGKNPVVSTYADIARQIAHLGGALKGSGAVPGTRLAVYAENDPLHFLLFFLSWIEGYVFVPLNRRVPFDVAVKDAAPDVVIVHDKECETGGMIVTTAESLFRNFKPEMIALPDFAALDLDRECSIVFTSGSTGKPRGVVHTIANHVYSGLGVISFFGLKPGDRWLVSLPLNHVGGLSIFTRTFLSGGTVVFPETRQGVTAAIKDRAADYISVVPTQLIRYMTVEPQADSFIDALLSMRAILMGGAPAPGWVIDRALALSLPIVPSYGSTESCSLVTAVVPGSAATAYKTAGKVLPHRQLRRDSDGRIMLAGKTRFAHYLEDGKKCYPFDDGWFKTSDLGEIDENGNWIILGRADEIFISGGENINPLEIEKRLMEITDIDTAVVVPVPHPEFGLVPWAFVSSSKDLHLPDVTTLLKKTLPPFKIPKKILFADPKEGAVGIKPDRAYFRRKAAIMAAGDY